MRQNIKCDLCEYQWSSTDQQMLNIFQMTQFKKMLVFLVTILFLFDVHQSRCSIINWSIILIINHDHVLLYKKNNTIIENYLHLWYKQFVSNNNSNL